MIVLFNLLTSCSVPIMQAVQTEDAISQEVGLVLSQQFSVVEHAKELVEVLTDHDEIER